MLAARARRRACLAVTLACLVPPVALGQARPPPRDLPPLQADGGVVGGLAFLQTLPPAAREALRQDGQVLLDQRSAGSGPTHIRAVVRFDVPRREVFELIARPAEQSTYLPHVQQSKPVGQPTAEGERDDFEVSFIFSFRYRTQHWFYPDLGRVEWNLDPSGGDGLEAQLGYWQLYELDEKTTLGEYGTHLVARGALLNFFRSLGERGAIGEALTAFRRHIETAGP
jgi:hypothetical protein